MACACVASAALTSCFIMLTCTRQTRRTPGNTGMLHTCGLPCGPPSFHPHPTSSIYCVRHLRPQCRKGCSDTAASYTCSRKARSRSIVSPLSRHLLTHSSLTSYFTHQYDRAFGGGQRAGMRLWERVRFGKDGQTAAAAAASSPAPSEAGAPAAAAAAPAAAPAAPAPARAARWGHMYTSLVCQSCHHQKTKWLVSGCLGEIHSFILCQDQLI